MSGKAGDRILTQLRRLDAMKASPDDKMCAMQAMPVRVKTSQAVGEQRGMEADAEIRILAAPAE